MELESKAKKGKGVVSLEDLAFVKNNLHKIAKEEIPAEEQLQRVYKRFLKTQYLQDHILSKVYTTLKDKDIKKVNEMVIKVYRGEKLYYCSCNEKFNYAGKEFLICTHDKKVEKAGKLETETLEFIEELSILECYNIALREISPRTYKK